MLHMRIDKCREGRINVSRDGNKKRAHSFLMWDVLRNSKKTLEMKPE